MMEELNKLERMFLEMLRRLNDQQRDDVMRILNALQHSRK